MLLGGSPLRLFRISERARRLVERWRAGPPVGPRRPAQLLARRLVSAGAFVPPTGGHASDPTTSRSWCRCATGRRSSTGCSTRSGGLACVVVDDASADAGATKEIAERHGARFVGLATNVGPAGARNAGLAAVAHRAGRLRGLRLRADRRVARAVAGPLRRPVGGGGGTADRADAGRSRPLRSGALVARPGRPRQGRSGPGAASPSSRARPSWSGPTWRLGPDLFDPALRGGEDVDLVWRLGEAGWDVRYVPSSTCRPRGPDDAASASWPAAPSTGRPPRRWPGATARPWLPSTCPVGRWPCGASCSPAAPCSPGGAGGVHRHPGPPPARAGTGPGRRGDAHRRRRHGARGPAGARRR